MSTGERIKELINSKGITAYEAAKLTGISQPTFSRILNSKTSKMSMNSVKKLAEYFHVNKDWLATGMGDKHYSSPTDSVVVVECPHCRELIEEKARLTQQLEDKIEIIKLQRDLLKAYQVDPTVRFSRNGKHKAG